MSTEPLIDVDGVVVFVKVFYLTSPPGDPRPYSRGYLLFRRTATFFHADEPVWRVSFAIPIEVLAE